MTITNTTIQPDENYQIAENILTNTIVLYEYINNHSFADNRYKGNPNFWIGRLRTWYNRAVKNIGKKEVYHKHVDRLNDFLDRLNDVTDHIQFTEDLHKLCGRFNVTDVKDQPEMTNNDLRVPDKDKDIHIVQNVAALISFCYNNGLDHFRKSNCYRPDNVIFNQATKQTLGNVYGELYKITKTEPNLFAVRSIYVYVIAVNDNFNNPEFHNQMDMIFKKNSANNE